MGARAKRLMPDRLFDFLLRRNLGVWQEVGTRPARKQAPTNAEPGVGAV